MVSNSVICSTLRYGFPKLGRAEMLSACRVSQPCWPSMPELSLQIKLLKLFTICLGSIRPAEIEPKTAESEAVSLPKRHSGRQSYS